MESVSDTAERRIRLIWILLLSVNIVVLIVSVPSWVRAGGGRSAATWASNLGTFALIFLSLSGLTKEPAKSWLLGIGALIVATEVWITLF